MLDDPFSRARRPHEVIRQSTTRDRYQCRACPWHGRLSDGIAHAVARQYDVGWRPETPTNEAQNAHTSETT